MHFSTIRNISSIYTVLFLYFTYIPTSFGFIQTSSVIFIPDNGWMKPNIFGFYVKDEIMQNILLVYFLSTTTIYFFPENIYKNYILAVLSFDWIRIPFICILCIKCNLYVLKVQQDRQLIANTYTTNVTNSRSVFLPHTEIQHIHP